MASNGDKTLKGIQLVLEEIRDIKLETRAVLLEMRDFRKDFREHMIKAEEDRRRSDDRFEALMAEMREERRENERARRRMERVFLGVARGIRSDLRELKGQGRRTAEILGRMEKNQRAGGNGHPNGGTP